MARIAPEFRAALAAALLAMIVARFGRFARFGIAGFAVASLTMFSGLLPGASGGGGGTGGYYVPLTIDHTKCGSSDSSNFPVLVDLTDANLKTVANGGHVDNTAGVNSIRFYSDSGLTTLLKFERESYDATTGHILAWVKIPTVSHSADTVFYMKYGAPGDTSDVSDKTNVWTGPGYQIVVHGGDGTTISGADSTSNNQTPTLAGSPNPTASTGKIGGAMHFVHANQQRITYSDIAAMRPGSAGLTLSLWAKPTSLGSFQVAACKGDNGNAAYNLENDSGSGGLMYAVFTQGSGNFKNTTAAVSTGAWALWHMTYDNSGNLRIYKNGSLASTHSGLSGNADSGSGKSFAIGQNGGSGGNEYDGDIDEVRVAIGTPISADWITTEYNNQNSPGTFIAEGSEVAL